jgi:hypothetical protein
MLKEPANITSSSTLLLNSRKLLGMLQTLYCIIRSNRSKYQHLCQGNWLNRRFATR